MARSVGVTDRQIFTKILLPASAPNIMSDLRLSLGLAVVAVIAGEILASNTGLGRIIDNMSITIDTAQMYDIIILIILVALGMYLLLTAIERKALPYARF